MGGHVLETYTPDEYGPRPALSPLKEKARKAGIPAPLYRKGVKEGKEKTGIDVEKLSSGVGHVKRSRWAWLTVAGMLAAADGPLPFGDAAAVALLLAYGTYEAVEAVGDFREGLGR